MTTHTPDERPDDRAAPAARHDVDGPADPALARLRAADPAPDATADVEAIRAAVRDRVPEAFGAAAATALPAVPDELAVRRDRRRRAPLQVAAAVVGALVVGTGGYALGAGGGLGTDGSGVTTTSAHAPVELGATMQGEAAAGTQEELAAGAEALTDVGPAAPGMSTRMLLPGFGAGRTVFHEDGLSREDGTAEAWAYDAAGVFSSQTARRVADVLGVEGDVREEHGSYVVGQRDGTGPSVSLQPDGLASVSFNDPSKDPWGCVVVTPMPGSATAPGADAPAAEPGTCAEADHGAPPSGEAAAGELRDVMSALGLDVAGFEIVPEDVPADQEAPRATTVTAHEVVAGQRTGTSWSATYSGAGLASLYGGLAQRVPLGDYDVVSPAEAVERLGDPRFAGGGPVLWAREDASTQAVPEILPAPEEPAVPTVPPTVSAGSAFAWPVTDVTITGSRLGLAVQHQPDGAAVLLPAYELVDAEGSVWSMVAVADGRLDFTATTG